jgi:hypothetical protein
MLCGRGRVRTQDLEGTRRALAGRINHHSTESESTRPVYQQTCRCICIGNSLGNIFKYLPVSAFIHFQIHWHTNTGSLYLVCLSMYHCICMYWYVFCMHRQTRYCICIYLHQRYCIDQINTYRFVQTHTDTCDKNRYIQINTNTYKYIPCSYSPGPALVFTWR